MRKIFAGIFLAFLLLAAGVLLHDAWLTRKNINEKEEMAQLFLQEEADALAQQADTVHPAKPGDGQNDIGKDGEEKDNGGENGVKENIGGKNADGERPLAKVFKSLKEINPDVVGMLVIPGTSITYPVLQKDNSYYLEHNIRGESDRHGSIFLDENCDTRSETNYVVYGHAMKDGTMFGSLQKYEDSHYLAQHDTAYLYTEYGKYTYTLSVVYLSEGAESTDALYEAFPIASGESAEAEEYRAFWELVAQSTGNDISGICAAGDSLLMLVTCAYHEEDGRMMLIGTQKRKDVEYGKKG